MTISPSDLAAALNMEIKRLPKWKFRHMRITSWVLGFPAPSIENGRATARATPLLNGDCDGCGSHLWSMVEDGDTPQSTAKRMVDRLLADPAFEKSVGTPIA